MKLIFSARDSGSRRQQSIPPPAGIILSSSEGEGREDQEELTQVSTLPPQWCHHPIKGLFLDACWCGWWVSRHAQGHSWDRPSGAKKMEELSPRRKYLGGKMLMGANKENATRVESSVIFSTIWLVWVNAWWTNKPRVHCSSCPRVKSSSENQKSTSKVPFRFSRWHVNFLEVDLCNCSWLTIHLALPCHDSSGQHVNSKHTTEWPDACLT